MRIFTRSILSAATLFCVLHCFSQTLPTTSFVGTQVSVVENAGTVSVSVNLANGNGLPSSVDVELIPFATATAGADFTVPQTLKLTWPASSNGVRQAISFTITNDQLPEAAEYFTIRLTNPVNLNLPSTNANQFTVFILDDDKKAPIPSKAIRLKHTGSFSNGPAGTNSAEIVTYDAGSKRLFIANSVGAKLDIVDFSNPAALTLIKSISVTPWGNINSVAVHNGIVAVAMENVAPQAPGKVVFFDVDGQYINAVTVGAMPDMITFNHAGTKVLTANEGEPNAAYTIDPEGSVSIIDISGGIAGLTQTHVVTAGFTAFNAQLSHLRQIGVRIFGPIATVAQNLEPEYITINETDTKAWISLQENNALAELDLATNSITRILPLGVKDHMLPGQALDVSDQSGTVQIANWPVKGVYMPDAIASYTIGGKTYVVTANEGDAREYNGYSEINRLSSAAYVLDPIQFPNANVVKANLGRLNVSFASGDTDGDGDYDEIHAFGGRSISIWNAATGQRVWDSGDDMERIIAQHPVFGPLFNASNANNTLKNRSDDKGPEPEGLAMATIYGQRYAFVALERIGGCMVYDVTDPANPVFVEYQNTRTVGSYGGDQGAEGIIYIKGSESPTGKPYVILANEVSSTLTVYEVDVNCPSYVANITVSPNPIVSRQSLNTIYLGYGPQQLTLSAATTPAITGTALYSWLPVMSTDAVITVGPKVSTTYQVTVRDEYGCESTASQFITVMDIRDGEKNKVFVCHKGKTQSVSVNAVPALLAQGSLLGGCPSYTTADEAFEVRSGLRAAHLSLSPNPVKQIARLNIELAKEERVRINIVDISGRIVQHRTERMMQAGSHLVEINTAALKSGTYYIQVMIGGKTEQVQMIVLQ